jgi:peptidoglycan/LPS O-acetylase OafA/YrhL
MRRIPELDAARGLAAVAIVLHHIWLPTYGLLSTAVDLFFVLSGYLITTIILQQHERAGFLRVFYARRALRIWPIYYLALVVVVVVNALSPAPASIAAWPYYLTYTQRLPLPFPVGFKHTWTLAIEEQFYIIWPLLLFRFGRRGLLPCALGAIALAVGTRSAGVTPWIILTRADGLALGGLLAWLLEVKAGRPVKTWNFAAISLAALVYVALADLLPGLLAGARLAEPARALAHWGPRTLAINLFYFGLVGCLVRGAGSRALALLRERRLCALGQISYGLYLYHYIIFYFLGEFGGREQLGPWGLGIVATFTSLGVAALSWHYIERPLLALKDRIGYAAPRPAAGGRRPTWLDSLRYEGS